MSVARITPKGQILVPKNLRRKLGLKPGGKVQWSSTTDVLSSRRFLPILSKPLLDS
jgi:AbrB family looped-hinge helix DNA binding protein